LYEMCTGRVPFTGTSAIAVGFQQMKEDPPRPRDLNAQLPLELESVVLKALQKDPLYRYASVADFRNDLEKAMSQSPAAASVNQVSSQAESQRVKIVG